MIKKLHIENFQSHTDSELIFDPGVNVIIGQSDSGKSAVIRALNWVCNNKPAGDEYRSDWGGDTVVTIDLKEKVSVIREKRGKTGNFYFMEYAGNRSGDGHVEEFKAFGNNVPVEIRDHINMTDINWQRQLDPPFLLSSTSGDVAQKLNDIVNLSVIDSSLSSIQSRKKKKTQEIKEKEAIIAEHREDLKRFEHLSEFKRQLDKVEHINKRACELGESLTKLESAEEKIQVIEKKVLEAEEVLKHEKKVGEIDSAIAEKNGLSENLEEVNELHDRLESCETKIERHEKTLKHEERIEKTLNAGRKLEKMKRKRKRLDTLLAKLEVNQVIVEDQEAEIEMIEEQYEYELKKMKVCELCGQEIS